MIQYFVRWAILHKAVRWATLHKAVREDREPALCVFLKQLTEPAQCVVLKALHGKRCTPWGLILLFEGFKDKAEDTFFGA